MKKIDIVDIKKQIRDGIIIPYISQGNIYLQNECGEVICIGNVEELTKKEEGYW